MSLKNNRFGSAKFKIKDEDSFERSQNIREERKVKEELPKIVFSFKDFDIKQTSPGQSYNDWQEEKLLAYMLQKFGDICELNIVEAQQQRVMKIYGDFPIKSEFKAPQHIADNVKWAVIMNIKGQKSRIAGHIIDNVFYVVFLDKDHKFFISEKKNT